MSENMTNSQIINDIVSSINEGDFSDDWFVGSVNLTVNGKTESVSVNKSVSRPAHTSNARRQRSA